MPQMSISYACGRIGVLKRSELTKAHMERLLAAPQLAEAQRVLADIGFAADQADFQTAADMHIQKACGLIQAVTTDKQMTDCYFLRYDVHNLKVLIKKPPAGTCAGVSFGLRQPGCGHPEALCGRPYLCRTAAGACRSLETAGKAYRSGV